MKIRLDAAALAGTRAMNRARAPLAPGFARFNTEDDEATVYIYGDIGGWFGGVDPETIAKEIAALDVSTLKVRLNSPGGLVFDGVAIYNALVEHKANVVVSIEGIAASIASVIAMAGDEIRIGEAANIMVHKPWSFAMGDAEIMRKEADVLDVLEDGIIAIYAARTGKSVEDLKALVAAETWFRGQQAVDEGFADEVIPAKTKKEKAAHSALLALYAHTPTDLAPAEGERLEVREFERLLREGERQPNAFAKRLAALASQVFAPKRDVSEPAPRDGDNHRSGFVASRLALADHIRSLTK